MNYISQINKCMFNELFDEFFQKSLNIIKNIQKSEHKYQMIQYLICYLQNFTLFFDKSKSKNILELIVKDFFNFNELKNYFKIANNLCDFLFYIIKDYENLEKYIIIIYNMLIKNPDSHENIYLLINLINKLLCYLEKENKSFFIDTINKSIKLLKESDFIKQEKEKGKYKEIISYYNKTIEYIDKKKNKKSNSIYDPIIL